MKVIFLDIDGVLNNDDTRFRRYYVHEITNKWTLCISNIMLYYLKLIVEETNSKIVLSSTWRKYFTKLEDKIIPVDEDGIELLELFQKFNLSIYDLTPYVSSGIRGNEIKEYLSNNDISSFVIIDDETSDIADLDDYIVKTRDNDKNILGLNLNHVNRAIEILNQEKLIKKFNY